MPCLEQDLVGQQSGHTSVPVSERMQINEMSVEDCCGEHWGQSLLNGAFGMCKKVRNPLDQLFMVAKERIPGTHVHCSIFAGAGSWVAIGNGMMRQCGMQRKDVIFRQRTLYRSKHLLVCVEVVKHLHRLHQRLVLGHHPQSQFLQRLGVIDGIGTSLYAKAVSRKQNFIVLKIVLCSHLLHHRLLVFCQKFVICLFQIFTHINAPFKACG